MINHWKISSKYVNMIYQWYTSEYSGLGAKITVTKEFGDRKYIRQRKNLRESILNHTFHQFN